MAHPIRFDGEFRWDFSFWDQLYPDNPPDLSKGEKFVYPYFIPRARAERRDWLRNASEKIATYGAAVGFTPADIGAFQATCAAQIALIDGVTNSETAYKGALAAEELGDGLNLTALKEEIARIKTARGYTDQIGAEMKIVSPSAGGFNPDTYKPEIKNARIVANEPRLDFVLKGAHGVHVYCGVGNGAMVKIATDSSSPYIDGRPNATPGVPEVRKYMLRGCDKDDKELGLDSDIVSITVPG